MGRSDCDGDASSSLGRAAEGVATGRALVVCVIAGAPMLLGAYQLDFAESLDAGPLVVAECSDTNRLASRSAARRVVRGPVSACSGWSDLSRGVDRRVDRWSQPRWRIATAFNRCPTSAQWAASGVAMYSHAAARLGWAACGFALVIWALHFVVWAAGGFPSGLGSTDPEGDWNDSFLRVAYAVTMGTASIIGAAVIARQPRNAIGWISLIAGLMIALDVASGAYATSPA